MPDSTAPTVDLRDPEGPRREPAAPAAERLPGRQIDLTQLDLTQRSVPDAEQVERAIAVEPPVVRDPSYYLG